METKLKVKVASLLEAVRERRTAAQQEWDERMAVYEAQEAAVPAHVIASLEAALETVRTGGELKRGYDARGYHIDVEIDNSIFPQKPAGTFHITEFDRLIQSLEMCTQETLMLGPSEMQRYLG